MEGILASFAKENGSRRRLLTSKRSREGLGNRQLAITDVVLLSKGHKCPPGYVRVGVFSGPANKEPAVAELNKGLQVAVAKGGTQRPITAVALIHEGLDEFVPAGFQVVGCLGGTAAQVDLSMGQGALGRMSLCICRGEGPPLTDLTLVLPSVRPLLPDDYCVVDRSPLGFPALLCIAKNNKNPTSLLLAYRNSPMSEWFSQDAQSLVHPGLYEHLDEQERKLLEQSSILECPLNEVGSVAPLLEACYLGGTMVACSALAHIELVLQSVPVSQGITECLLKAAADCVEKAQDVLFAPAMKVVAQALRNGPVGPLALHFCMLATLRTNLFFHMLPLKGYTSREQVIIEPLFEEQQASRADVFAGPTLDELNFVLRCPAVVFDTLTNRAAASSSPNEHVVDDNAEGAVTAIIDEVLCEVSSLRERMEATDRSVSRLARHSSAAPLFALEVGTCVRELNLGSAAAENAVAALLWLSCSACMPLKQPLRIKRGFNAEHNERASVLELIKEFLASSGCHCSRVHSNNEDVKVTVFQGHTFAYQLRRFAVPAVLANAAESSAELVLVLPVVGELWKNSRRHLKIELAVIVQQLLLPALVDRLAPPTLRKEVLESAVNLFASHGSDLVEMFLNFENDPVVGNWRSFENLVEALCRLSDPSQLVQSTEPESGIVSRELQFSALQGLVTLLKSLTDMSGTLRPKVDESSSTDCADDDGWDLLGDGTAAAPGSSIEGMSTVWTAGKNSSVRIRHSQRGQKASALQEAFAVARSKGVQKAVLLLVTQGLLENTPQCIAKLLHLYHRELGERNVGQYLGSRASEPFMNQLRLDFTRALPFAGKGFEACLRLFLERGHFFLPGEAQQVEALLIAFSRCFVEANGDRFPGCEADTFLVLAYSTVMLNTDLHNPAVKNKKKMTEEQFLKQISYIEGADKLGANFGVALYQSIALKEIKMASNVFHQQDLSALQMQKSSNAAFTTVTADPENGLDSLDLQPPISLDSLESAAGGSGSSGSNASGSNGGFSLTRSQATALFQQKVSELMTGAETMVSASVFQWRCFHTKVTSESIRVMFEISWVHLYSLVTKIVENPKTFSLDAVSLALDILSSSISVSLFLGMETERKAFAMLLARFHYLYTNSADQLGNAALAKGEHLKDQWFEDVMNTTSDSADVMGVIAEVHHLCTVMKEKIESRQRYERMLSVQKRFDGDVAIMDPGRCFVREGSLHKRSRQGKLQKYQFFLFNDLLLYASQTRTLTANKYHVHQMLALHTLQVREVDVKSFEVQHPRKSFVVVAASEQDKLDWMREIKYRAETVYHREVLNVSKTKLGDRSFSDNSKISASSSAASSYEPKVEQQQQQQQQHQQKQQEQKQHQRQQQQRSLKPARRISNGAISDMEEEDDENDSSIETTPVPSEALPVDKVDKVADSVVAKSTPISSTTSTEESKLDWLNTINSRAATVDRLIEQLSSEELHKRFQVGLHFAKPILTSSHAKYQANDEQKLLIYGLFKQSTQGDCSGETPSQSDWVSYSKYCVWAKLQGTSKDDSKRRFLTVLNSIAPGWSDRITTTTTSA